MNSDVSLKVLCTAFPDYKSYPVDTAPSLLGEAIFDMNMTAANYFIARRHDRNPVYSFLLEAFDVPTIVPNIYTFDEVKTLKFELLEEIHKAENVVETFKADYRLIKAEFRIDF